MTAEAVEKLGLTHSEYQQQTVVVVASHDCDLVQPPEKEPVVEVIIGREIERVDGNYTHAKASRTLHIDFDGEKHYLLVEFSATEKKFVKKKALVGYRPDLSHSLSPESKITFQRWLASRYHRAAFPDEFEKRLQESKVAASLQKAVKPYGEHITAVLLDVDEGVENHRRGPDDVNILDMVLLHATSPDLKAAELAAIKAKEKIKAAFIEKLYDAKSGLWKNVELRYIDVVSEEALTYRQFTTMKRWRLDHLSLGAEPQSPIAPE